MMWILIIIFIASLLATFGMLFYRAWQIEKGKVVIPEDQEERMVVPEMTFASIKSNVLYYSKRSLHLLILTLIKIWVLATHKITKKMNAWLFPGRLDEKFDDGNTLSQFLKAISDYKARMKRFRERVKARERIEEENENSTTQ